MRPSDLNRAVARATGESVATIKRLGFFLAEPESPVPPEDDDLGPQVIDWDALEEARAWRPARESAHAAPRH